MKMKKLTKDDLGFLIELLDDIPVGYPDDDESLEKFGALTDKLVDMFNNCQN